MRDWLSPAASRSWRSRGDYLTMRIAGEPIAVARTDTGELARLLHMCVHRGVEVVEGCGNARAFKCPYHGWIYDLSGRLTGAAYMKECAGFDTAAPRMRPLRIETWRRNIFVTFRPRRAAPRRVRRRVRQGLRLPRMEDADSATGSSSTRVQLEVRPREPHGLLPRGRPAREDIRGEVRLDDDNVQLSRAAGLTIFYAAGPPTPGAEPLLGKMPWLEDRPVSFACTGFLPRTARCSAASTACA